MMPKKFQDNNGLEANKVQFQVYSVDGWHPQKLAHSEKLKPPF
jgi:hypothetical protein